jgi:hypothetical protein
MGVGHPDLMFCVLTKRQIDECYDVWMDHRWGEDRLADEWAETRSRIAGDGSSIKANRLKYQSIDPATRRKAIAASFLAQASKHNSTFKRQRR